MGPSALCESSGRGWMIVGSTGKRDIARIRIYDAMHLLVCGNIHEVEVSFMTGFPAMIILDQPQAKFLWDDFDRPDPGAWVLTNLFSPLRRACFRAFAAWTGMGLCFFYSSCPTIWRLFEASRLGGWTSFLSPSQRHRRTSDGTLCVQRLHGMGLIFCAGFALARVGLVKMFTKDKACFCWPLKGRD